MAANNVTRRIARWFGFAGKQPITLDPTRADLVIVASCFDDAEACSTTLERAVHTDPALRPDEPAVLRHHLNVPADQLDEVLALAAQDGYEAAADSDRLVLRRVQLLDALHCSQERSRMAGLAQRHDGDVLGWDALQPNSTGGSGSH